MFEKQTAFAKLIANSFCFYIFAGTTVAELEKQNE